GATAGDGLSAFDERIPPYFFKASAIYPDGPFESGSAGEQQDHRGDGTTTTGMFAYARGIDVYGESNGGGDLVPGLIRVGNTSTVSTTTVVDGVMIAETIAAFSDLSIAGGLITIDGMQTRLNSRSNGDVAQTEGVYELSGMQINGQGFELTEEGITAVGPAGDPVVFPLPMGQSIDLRDAIGISVEAMPIIEELDGASASRSTRGVMITIDSSPLRTAAGAVPLADLISQIPDPLGADVVPCSSLPPEFNALPCFSNPISGLKANLFTIASLSPKFRILLGGAQVSTSASLPFEFIALPLPALATRPLPDTLTTTTFNPPAPSFTSPLLASVLAPEVSSAAPSQATQAQYVALGIPDGLSRGIGAGLFLLAGLSVFGFALVGKRLTMQAIYQGAGPVAAVNSGAVPDLRAFAQGEKF
ncbi:MAG: hypothetical protein ACI867_002376, partial [Glaciecola sp.]